MAQMDEASVVSKALFDLAVEQVRTLGVMVKTQQEQINTLHRELREVMGRSNRAVWTLTALLVASLGAVVRLTFMVWR